MSRYTKFKGTESEYTSLHAWVRRQLGTPSFCVDCGATEGKRFQWSNISGEYHRELSDWQRLCQGCHLLRDRGNMCRKGLHELTEENSYMHPGVGRRCRECKRQYRADYRRRNKK